MVNGAEYRSFSSGNVLEVFMRSILFKVGIIVFITISIAVLFGIFDSYNIARREEEEKALEVAENAALLMSSGSNGELTEYLYDYCMTHAEEMDVPTGADRSGTERYEEWLDNHGDVMRTYMTRAISLEDFKELDDETQKKYAECWYNIMRAGIDLVAEHASMENGDSVNILIYDYIDGEAIAFIFTSYSSLGAKALGVTIPFTLEKHPRVSEILNTHEPVSSAERIKNTTDGTVHLYAPTPLIINGHFKGIVAADWLWESSHKRLISRSLEIASRTLVYTLLADIFLMILMSLKIIAPIKKLQAQMMDYIENKDSGSVSRALEKLKARGDEIAELSNDFILLSDEIDRYVEEREENAKERAALDTELGIASMIQESALPSEFPAFPERKEFDIYASMTPTLAVGGDFYDFFLLDDDHLALVIADVSDKGIPAALFMMQVKTMINTLALLEGSKVHPTEIFEAINNSLNEQIESMMFVTVWMGILTISTGEMACANAGHKSPVICRSEDRERDGFRLYIKTHSPPLAAFNGVPYNSEDLSLHHGDVLFVYTDGVTEAASADDEFFGEDRLIAALNEVRDGSPEMIIGHVQKCVNDFSSGREQYDDITMLCFKYL